MGHFSFLSLLLIGLLSMMYAEVFAGSSQIWFIDPWSLLVTLPLYMFHTLFYLNLSFRTRRASIQHLYLWGCLFGLYEAPITKVLWSSFSPTGPIWGQLLGVSIFEFLTLVFFWHPVLAFVVPVIVYEVFSKGGLTKNHAYLLSSKWGKILLYGVAFVGSLTLGLNTQFNLARSLGAFGGSLALIGAVLGIIKLLKRPLDLKNLELGNKGFAAVIIYLVLLYASTWILIFPQKIGTPVGILSILVSALVFLLMIFKIPAPESKNTANRFQVKHVLQSWVLFGVLSIIWALIPQIAGVVGIVFFVLLPLIGVGIFLYNLVRVLRKQA